MRIGIVGYGFVGKAVAEFYGTDLIFDKFKNSKELNEVTKNADLIFLCVPSDGCAVGYNYDSLNESLGELSRLRFKNPVLIKSTVQPGKTEKFSKQFPNLDIYFNPEFLVQKTALEDFKNPKNPPYHILGFTKNRYKAEDIAVKIFENYGFDFKVTTATTAELCKTSTNAYLASRVVFANEIYDFANKIDADYDFISSVWSDQKRLGDYGYNISDDGFRGAGGYCLPKDLHALIKTSEEYSFNMDFLKKVEEKNDKLLEISGRRINSHSDEIKKL